MSETTSGTPKLNAALAKAQAQFEAAEKAALNPAFKDATQPAKAKGTRYADLTSVVAATRPALTANGLAVSQEPMEAEEGWVKVRTCLLHESGEERIATLKLPCAQKTAQAYGSALTYARRYAYSAMVGVVADEDDDGNAASGKKTAQSGEKTTEKTTPRPTPPPVPPADDIERAKARARAAFETSPDLPTLEDSWNKLARPLPKRDADELAPAYRARQQAIRQASGVKA